MLTTTVVVEAVGMWVTRSLRRVIHISISPLNPFDYAEGARFLQKNICIIHEIGHAIDTFTPFPDLHDVYQDEAGCLEVLCKTPDDYRFRAHGASETEGWADAFSVWVFTKTHGNPPGVGDWPLLNNLAVDFEKINNAVDNALKRFFVPPPRQTPSFYW